MDDICTNKRSLPVNLFRDNPFGMSPASPASKNEKPIETNLNIQRFRQLGFPEAYCHSLETGVPLLMHTIPQQCEIKNYSSVYEHEIFARETLEKWKKLGVYTETETKPHIISPLGVTLRDGKQRLVLDATVSGLNESLLVPKFKLPTHNSIINTMKYGDYMAKADFKNGFLQLPIRHTERKYLGFKHPFTQKYCMFNRLPFGIGPGTFLFQTFSEGVRRCMLIIFQIIAEAYIDDWFFRHKLDCAVKEFLDIFHALCNFLGITINTEKSEGPTQTLVFLGLLIDTVKCQLLLPEIKRIKYRMSIQHLLEHTHHKMELIAKAAGKLVHVALSIRPGGPTYNHYGMYCTVNGQNGQND